MLMLNPRPILGLVSIVAIGRVTINVYLSSLLLEGDELLDCSLKVGLKPTVSFMYPYAVFYPFVVGAVPLPGFQLPGAADRPPS